MLVGKSLPLSVFTTDVLVKWAARDASLARDLRRE
jgi:hypothetical protein